MDIDLMVLNVGNSRLGIGVFTGGVLEHAESVPHAQRGDWQAKISQAWGRIANKSKPAIAAASVNPPLNDPLETLVLRITNHTVEWVGDELDLPIPVLTQSPQQTGVDRVLNIAAAYEQIGKGCVVVDAGTAITVDCCDDTGKFLGGAIGPGLGMMLDVLHEKTAALPRVTFQIPTETFGKSTEAAICQGVYHGLRGMVRALVENYAMELGAWPEVIATGGDAKQLFEDWELIHAVSPDLILYGIALAYTEHYIKHEK